MRLLPPVKPHTPWVHNPYAEEVLGRATHALQAWVDNFVPAKFNEAHYRAHPEILVHEFLTDLCLWCESRGIQWTKATQEAADEALVEYASVTEESR